MKYFLFLIILALYGCEDVTYRFDTAVSIEHCVNNVMYWQLNAPGAPVVLAIDEKTMQPMKCSDVQQQQHQMQSKYVQ